MIVESQLRFVEGDPHQRPFGFCRTQRVKELIASRGLDLRMIMKEMKEKKGCMKDQEGRDDSWKKSLRGAMVHHWYLVAGRNGGRFLE